MFLNTQSLDPTVSLFVFRGKKSTNHLIDLKIITVSMNFICEYVFMVLIKAVSHNYSERQFSQTHEHCFEIKRQPLKVEGPN